MRLKLNLLKYLSLDLGVHGRASGQRKQWRSALLASLLLAWPGINALAEEGGTGHYLPGSFASFMDGVATQETLIARINLVHYDGDVSVQRPLPIAGLTTVDAEARSTALGLTVFWRPEWGTLSEKWGYGMSATVPLMDVEVEATVTAAPGSYRAQSSLSGLGDILLMPLMFNYNVNPDLNINTRLTVYAPTGSYQVGRLANTSKNYWSFEPTVGVMYFGQKNGIELSLFSGICYNTENPDTDYKSGSQFHLDGTLAQHFPFAGGISSVGVTGYYYDQISDDTGSGAVFGAFRAKTTAIGPSVSYIKNLANSELLAELKWLHETETQNRLQGDTIFFKAMLSF